MSDTAASINTTNSDPVNHPSHYNADNGIECIEVIKIATEGLTGEYAFCVGNAIKYLFRCNKKGKFKEDLEKARWYLNRAIAGFEEDAPEAKAKKEKALPDQKAIPDLRQMLINPANGGYIPCHYEEG